METRPDIESLCCINEECKEYGNKGRGNLRVRKIYGQDEIRYLRCNKCQYEFSERKSTALYNSKISESKAAAIIEHLDSRCGIVATARLVKVSKDTVSRLSRVAGRTFQQLHDVKVTEVKARALEFDEKWSFIMKKQKNITIDDDVEEVGEHWDVNCIDPESKLLLTLVTGARTAETIHQAVSDAAQRLAQGSHPAIFNDGEPAYQDAILAVFGHPYPAPRSSHLGRPPVPIIRVPQDLSYAQIIKHRTRGKVEHVEIRPIFGKGKLDAIVASLGWHKPNTSAIERFNLTDRTRNARKVRKTLTFSKNVHLHDAMSFISVLLYNFHHYHRSLTRRTDDGQVIKRTPAMAAGLADRQFSILDLLRLSSLAR